MLGDLKKNDVARTRDIAGTAAGVRNNDDRLYYSVPLIPTLLALVS